MTVVFIPGQGSVPVSGPQLEFSNERNGSAKLPRPSVTVAAGQQLNIPPPDLLDLSSDSRLEMEVLLDALD